MKITEDNSPIEDNSNEADNKPNEYIDTAEQTEATEPNEADETSHAEAPVDGTDSQQEKASPQNTDNENESQNADLYREEKNEVNPRSKNKRAKAKAFYAVVCVFLLLFSAGYGILNGMLDQIHAEELTAKEKSATKEEQEESITETIYDDEDYALFQAVTAAGSLNDYVYQWYNSGTVMRSKNVINVLLLAIDSNNGLEVGGNSDTMILVSLNLKTQKIKMVSFFRDTWAYHNANGTDYYGKLNSAYAHGGADCTVQTIENMFKIQIDHYVICDILSFKHMIDAIGGITVDVQEYEANNMLREFDVQVEFGENIHLGGQAALAFARQRHSDADADVSRTRRQRMVINAFIDSCKGASFSQLSNTLNTVIKYIKTDMTKNEILGYATRALAGGWLDYEMKTFNIADQSIFQTPTINGMSIVVQDYPKVSQIVQTEVYGESNIILSADRVTAFQMY